MMGISKVGLTYENKTLPRPFRRANAIYSLVYDEKSRFDMVSQGRATDFPVCSKLSDALRNK